MTSDLEQSLVFGLALDGSGSELEPEAVLERRPIWCHFDGSQSGSTAALAAMGLESRVVERQYDFCLDEFERSKENQDR